MNNKIKHERYSHIDAIAGLLIINMILGHCIQKTGMKEMDLYHYMNVLSFFMPWFFFKSGMFSKVKSVRDTAINGLYKFMRPYLIWNIAGLIPFFLLKVANHDYVWYHYILQPFKGILLDGQYSGNSPLWFLLNLWIIQIVYSFVNQRNIPKYLLLTFSFLGGYLCFVFEINTPSYIASVSTGLFFYCMGDLLRQIQYSKIAFILSSIVYISFLFSEISFVDINTNTLQSGNYFLWPIFALSGIVCINNLFMYGIEYIQKIKIFNHIGENSMSYYVSHWIIINIGVLLFEYVLNWHNINLLCSCIILCMVMLPIINKKVN